jgi:hypothetical protein
MAKTSELEAINIMLSAAGTAPVSSLPSLGNSTPDATQAENILNEARRDVLTKRWNFNTEDEVEVTTSPSTGEYVVPAAYVEVDGTRGKNGTMDLVERTSAGTTKLYDRKAKTFNLGLGATIYLDVVIEVLYAEMPQVFRHYVMVKAARLFVDRVVGDQGAHIYSLQDEQRAKMAAEKANARSADHNMLTGNKSTFRIVNRRAPLDRMS